MSPEPGLDRRSFTGVTAAAAMVGLAGCAALQPAGETTNSEAAESWPDPKEGQREVMLLGSTHLAQSPGDTQNAYATDPGDILGDQRQNELETLTDRLAEWDPDRIAVEESVPQQSVIDDAYAAYRDDTRDLTTVSGWETDRSNEIVQIGFRLADKLGHDSVAAVDYLQSPAALLTDEEKQQLPDSLRPLLVDPDTVEYPLPDIAERNAAEQQRLDEGSLVEFYRWLNTPDVGSTMWDNDMNFYAMAFENSEPGDYTSVKLMTAWTQRNLRIASNIWNVPAEDDERVLVVYGASHIPQLGQILTGAPMMAPVSPLPYLTE
jgi:hypothetical protein